MAPTQSTALVPIAPVFTSTGRLALAGFLAGYSGQAYELDLGQFASWCQQHQLRLFQACRACATRGKRRNKQLRTQIERLTGELARDIANRPACRQSR